MSRKARYMVALVLAFTFTSKAWAGEAGYKTRETTEPWSGYSEKSRAFGSLPFMGEYLAPKKVSEFRSPDQRQVVYDLLVRPSDPLKWVNLLNRLSDLAGTVPGIKSPDTAGPLDDRSPTHYIFESYYGSMRLRVLNDGTYGLYRFSPSTDGAGRFRQSNPQHPSNWTLLSRGEAIDRLRASMSYQTNLHRAPDPTFRHVFAKTAGVAWQPYFALLRPGRDPNLSTILQWPKDKAVRVNLPGRDGVVTTVGGFLQGNLPGPKVAGPAFRNVGAGSFGHGRMANVWQRDFKCGMPISRTVRETVDWSRRTGAREVAVVYNREGASLARQLKDGMERQGLAVKLIRDDRLSPTTVVGSSMGAALRNWQKASLAFTVDGRQGLADFPRHPGDFSEPGKLVPAAAGAGLPAMRHITQGPPPPNQNFGKVDGVQTTQTAASGNFPAGGAAGSGQSKAIAPAPRCPIPDPTLPSPVDHSYGKGSCGGIGSGGRFSMPSVPAFHAPSFSMPSMPHFR